VLTSHAHHHQITTKELVLFGPEALVIGTTPAKTVPNNRMTG